MNEEEYAEALKIEGHKWQQLGVNPDTILPQGGNVGLAVKVDMLVSMLIDMNIIDGEVWIERFYDNFLTTMKEIREQLEPEIQKQKIAALKNGRLGRKGRLT